MSIQEICAKFNIDCKNSKEVGMGHINTTSVVEDVDGKKYVLQKININVFPNIDELMFNIESVTNFINKKIKNENSSIRNETLHFLQSNGKPYVKDSETGDYYRAYKYIDDVNVYNSAEIKLLYEAGVGFGRFQKQLSDFPANTLYETIPNFHNTPFRLKTLCDLIDNLSKIDTQKLTISETEIKEIFKKQYFANMIYYPLSVGQIPQRVVHNDTKLNNVMMDSKTGKAVCIIDLDTIMSGSMLYDYGDAIRFCANSGLEDDLNLKNVSLDLKKFEAFTRGYLSEMAESITENELKLMPYAPIVMTYELAIRFLQDYLDGDVYFKTDKTRPKHNLERTRAQLKLMQDMQKKTIKMEQIISKYYEEFTSFNRK